MTGIALEPASHRSHAELAELFTAAYRGYFTPIEVDEAAFRFMAAVWDDDLDAARVAVVDGVPAGICKLGIRGEEGWIGGMGVVPAERRRGLGEMLLRAVLDEARGRGLRRVWLEVLVQNAPAIRLYEALGFRHERELEVWTLEPLVFQEHKVRFVTGEEAHTRIRRERTRREPWQRSDETVANLEGVEGLESERGAVLFRRTGERISLLQGVAAGELAARELLEGLPSDATGLQWLNGPAGDPFNEAIAALGGTLAHRQHELVLEL